LQSEKSQLLYQIADLQKRNIALQKDFDKSKPRKGPPKEEARFADSQDSLPSAVQHMNDYRIPTTRNIITLLGDRYTIVAKYRDYSQDACDLVLTDTTVSAGEPDVEQKIAGMKGKPDYGNIDGHSVRFIYRGPMTYNSDVCNFDVSLQSE
jgi:hypothetical protein